MQNLKLADTSNTSKALITEAVPDFFIRGLEEQGFHPFIKTDIDKEELDHIIGDYTLILVRSRHQLPKSTLEKAVHLKYILRPGSGLEIIDTEYARERGILVINSPEGNRDAVGEHALGLLLCLMNRIVFAHNQISGGQWERRANTGIELKYKTVGIIGFGNTGSAFAEKLRGFEAKILAYDKYKEYYAPVGVIECNQNVIFEQSDIVSFHIPLDAANSHLINYTYLKKFRKPVFLINTSRGGILKNEDLLRAIKEGIVSGAALDVLENEDIDSCTEEERSFMDECFAIERIIFTPHVAGWTKESEKKIFSVLLEKLNSV
jgi:D-3-phosphoglycerate dehydrogenase / 2-oxoglutarate reductase